MLYHAVQCLTMQCNALQCPQVLAAVLLAALSTPAWGEEVAVDAATDGQSSGSEMNVVKTYDLKTAETGKPSWQ